MFRLKITESRIATIGTVIGAIVGVIGLIFGTPVGCEKNDNMVDDNSKPIKIEVASNPKPEIKKLPSSSEVPALQPSTASPTMSNKGK